MKKLVAPLLIGAIFGSYAFAAQDADLKAEVEALKAQMKELQNTQKKFNIEALKSQLLEVKAHDAHDNIKFSADFRTAYDAISYGTSDAAGANSTVKNGIWTNKLILNMAAQPRDDLVFRGALGMYKTFGYNNTAALNGFQNMDWYSSETPSDTTLRVKEAYFLYLGQAGDMPYTVSFGRRPSVTGFLTNLREDDTHPASPIGHNINMEFDGASFMVNVEKYTGVSGMYFKLCLGRGNSNVNGKYPAFTGFNGSNLSYAGATSLALPYSQGVSQYYAPNMDLAGLLAQLYNDGQYKVMANWFKGWNMMGADFTRVGGAGTPLDPTDDTFSMHLKDVGDLTGGALSLQVDGIGDGISDFLDDTTAFASFAWSTTHPKGVTNTIASEEGMVSAGPGMLGSSKSETGTSIYVGVQMPGFFDNDRIGIEYNHGSKYWRSFTYGEDTLIGSKLSTRGNAYEIYYNFPVLDRFLTAQIRYTYIDYDYTGSDMFFGSTGTPLTKSEAAAQGMGFVDNAQDIRLSLRYRY
ncbi:DUF3373 family protein [Sulfurospirillum sp. 1612]|uniref:DUF3373 family protein n=1 Tax=Sulfurospirillum sp. 1612 TaxID=3094835 RepID=UPI002F956FE1